MTHEIYAAHSFDDDMVQTLFGKDIEFSIRTFWFAGGQTSCDQEQTISCELYLEPVGDVPMNKIDIFQLFQ